MTEMMRKYFRTTKRTISITTLHNNDQVPLYTKGHDANTLTELVDRTTAYPALDREILRSGLLCTLRYLSPRVI